MLYQTAIEYCIHSETRSQTNLDEFLSMLNRYVGKGFNYHLGSIYVSIYSPKYLLLLYL